MASLELQCEGSLQLIGQISIKIVAEQVAKHLSTALQSIQDVSQFQDTEGGPHDQSVVEAIQKVHEAVHVSFIFARAFIGKAHSLAKYICSEEPYTIKAIEEGDAKGFKDYLEEVLDKSNGCRKDLKALIDFIDNDRMKEIDEQKEQVEERMEIASIDATSAKIHTGVGVVAAAGGTAVALGGTGVGAAGAIAVQVGGAKMAAVGVAFIAPGGVAVIGLTVAIAGLIYAAKSYTSYKKHKEMVAYCEKAIAVIEEMKAGLQEIEKLLKDVNSALKAEIEHRYEDVSDRQLEKLGRQSGPVIRSLKGKVQEVTEGANHLMEYCQPLKEADNLQEFIQRVTSNH